MPLDNQQQPEPPRLGDLLQKTKQKPRKRKSKSVSRNIYLVLGVFACLGILLVIGGFIIINTRQSSPMELPTQAVLPPISTSSSTAVINTNDEVVSSSASTRQPLPTEFPTRTPFPTQTPRPTQTDVPASPTWASTAVLTHSEEIAYFDGDFEDAVDIRLLNIANGSMTTLASNLSMISSPTWSPDGTALAFDSQIGDDVDDLKVVSVLDLYPTGKTSLGGGVARRLTDSLFSCRSPVWSSTNIIAMLCGDEAIYGSDSQGNLVALTVEGTEIYTIRPDGTEFTRVTTNQGAEQSLAWLPDGQRIAFLYRDGIGETNVEILDLATGTMQPLVLGNPLAQFPTWSPNGQFIAFMSQYRAADGQFIKTTIEIATSDGSNRRVLADVGKFRVSRPVWSPDGQYVAYKPLNSPQNDSMVIINVATGEQRLVPMIVSAFSYETELAWRP